MRLAIILTSSASWYLVGLGVTVGTTTYPSFALVGDEDWAAFHDQHSTRISWAVGPAWVAQAAGIIWWFTSGAEVGAWWFTAVLALGAVAMTAGMAVDLHRQLGVARSTAILKRLRVVHSLRTVAWIGAALAATIALR